MQHQQAHAAFTILTRGQSEQAETSRCHHAGMDMGEEDLANGIFDDTPPPTITGRYAAVYQSAYHAANAEPALAAHA